MRCPVCDSGVSESGGVFYERGEWVNGSYGDEGNANVYSCSSCGAEFAMIVTPVSTETSPCLLKGEASGFEYVVEDVPVGATMNRSQAIDALECAFREELRSCDAETLREEVVARLGCDPGEILAE